jgi:hypothetical protein
MQTPCCTRLRVSLQVRARYGLRREKKWGHEMNADQRATKWTRREALGMFGAGLAAAALPYAARAQPSFVEGAVIRTILRDYAPGELGGGAAYSTSTCRLLPTFSRDSGGTRPRRRP